MPRKRSACPVCDAPVVTGEDWKLTTPLNENFTYCSLNCLIYGADNLNIYEPEEAEAD